MAKGFDTAQDCTAHGQQIKDAGYEFVARYYFSGISHEKVKLSRAEALHLSSMGLYLVSVFENAGDHAGYFSGTQGQADGVSAFGYAHDTIGQPNGTPVYFAVDFDATENDLWKIGPYFEGIRRWMHNNGGYAVGVYGSGFVCRRLKELGLVSFTWLAQSRGWSESETYTGWNIKQFASSTFVDMDIDLDISNGNGGGWRIE